jgi:aryl-alcohol dehydrogenase-like predicted oxidoreductase
MTFARETWFGIVTSRWPSDKAHADDRAKHFSVALNTAVHVVYHCVLRCGIVNLRGVTPAREIVEALGDLVRTGKIRYLRIFGSIVRQCVQP